MNIEPNAVPIDKGRYYPVDFEGIKGARYYLITRFKEPTETVDNLTLIGQDFHVRTVQLTEDGVIFESTHSRDVYLDDTGAEVFSIWTEDTEDKIVDMGNYTNLGTTPGFVFSLSKDEVDSRLMDEGRTRVEIYQTIIRRKASNSILSATARNRRVGVAQAAAAAGAPSPTVKTVKNTKNISTKETLNRRLHMLAVLRNQGGGSKKMGTTSRFFTRRKTLKKRRPHSRRNGLRRL